RRHDRSVRDPRAPAALRPGRAHLTAYGVSCRGTTRSDLLMSLIVKDIPAHERLIFALDVADHDAARELATRLGDAVQFYKIGLELCMSRRFFDLLDWLVARRMRVFVDLKFFDVPATVAAAV